LPPCKKSAVAENCTYCLPAASPGAGQACKILQQQISYSEPNKWWGGQFIDQKKKEIPQKIPIGSRIKVPNVG
jgi:hypothetical protein